MKYDQKQIENLIRKRSKELSTEEIIKIDARMNHEGTSYESRKKRIQKLGKLGVQFIRFGNTIFIVMSVQRGTVDFHLMNADAPENYLVNLVTFLAFLKDKGMKRAVTSIKNKKSLGVLDINNLPDFVTVVPSESPNAEFDVVVDLVRMGAQNG